MSTVEAIVSYRVAIFPNRRNIGSSYATATLLAHEMVSRTNTSTGQVFFEVREYKQELGWRDSDTYDDPSDPDEVNTPSSVNYSMDDVWRAYDDVRERMVESFGDIAHEVELFHGERGNRDVETIEDARTSSDFVSVTSYIFRCSSKHMDDGEFKLVKFVQPNRYALLTFVSRGGENNAIIWKDMPGAHRMVTGTFEYSYVQGDDNIRALARDISDYFERRSMARREELHNRVSEIVDKNDRRNDVTAA
jgi:hypothetical protein